MKHKHYNEVIAFMEGKEVRGRQKSDNTDHAWQSMYKFTFRDDWEYRWYRLAFGVFCQTNYS